MANLQKLDNYAKEKNLPAYVPEKIGCGLANGDWNKIKDFIKKETDIIIVSLLYQRLKPDSRYFDIELYKQDVDKMTPVMFFILLTLSIMYSKM